MAGVSVRRRVLPREQRLADVVREASRLFYEKGYEQTSVDELAAAMGLSVGGLYRYVSTKSDALVMVCDEIYAGLPEELALLAASSESAEESLTAVVRRYFESCVEHRWLILLLYREFRHLPEEGRSRAMGKEAAIVDVIARALKRTPRGRRLRPTDLRLLATDLVLVGHLPALKGWQVHRSGQQWVAYVDQQVSLLLSIALD